MSVPICVLHPPVSGSLMRSLAPKPGPPKERAALQEELSDVLIYLVALAARCRVDLPQAVLSKMDTNRRRYPAHLSRGSSLSLIHI